jgi:Protein of unknown function (DUF3768)
VTESSTARIRELNDAFRKTFAGGKMVMSTGVAELPEMVRASALIKVAEFTEFTLENDPHGEHDFLSFRALQPDVLLEMRLLQQGNGW